MARFVVASNRLPAIAVALPMLVGTVVEDSAAQIVMVAAESMEGQMTVSPPGHAPAIDSGLLHDSMQSKMTGPTSAMAYTNVEYAPHLEYGTVHMEARPFMVPAAEHVRPSFEQAVRVALRRI
jgi:hypothetical protein